MGKYLKNSSIFIKNKATKDEIALKLIYKKIDKHAQLHSE